MTENSLPRSSGFLLLIVGSILGALAFSWPLFIPQSDLLLLQPDGARFLAIIVALFAVLLIATEISRGAMDAKSVAILGVLSALIASLRLLGAGAVGVEPMWFLLILSSYAFGARFGFSLGVVAMGISALLTGGVGTWLPFQMIAAGWIGLLAGLIGKIQISRSKVRIVVLVVIGCFSSLSFGALMDLQLWPWLTGTDTQLSYLAGASVVENIQRFLVFHLATALAWDIPRAFTTSALLVLTATPVLHSFHRAKLRLNLIEPERVQTVNG